MKKIIALLAVAVLMAIAMLGCDTIKEWTRKTTAWEIGVAEKVLGDEDDKNSDGPIEESEDDDDEYDDDDGIVGWTKKTTEWEMREADKVISGKKTAPPARSGSAGKVCKVKDGCSVANVRSGPSTNNAVIGKLRGGDTVNVVEEKSGWVHVKLDNGNTGWVYGALVEYPAP